MRGGESCLFFELNNNLEYKSVNFPSNYHGLSSCSAKRFGKNVQIIIGGVLDKDFIAGTGYAVMYISSLRSAVGDVTNWLSGIEYNSNAICRLHYDDEFLYFESDKNISLGSSVYAFFNYIE